MKKISERILKSKIFAVTPARNEAETIFGLVKKTQKYVSKVIVVNEASKDNTAKLAREAGAVVLNHAVNLGKGAAQKTGNDYAVSQGADILVNLDADGQHDPDEIPKLLAALKNSDLVLGIRRFNKNMPFIKRAWNFGITILFSWLYRTKVKDQQCGFRVFSADTYKKIRWKSVDYLVETEMLINLLKRKLRLKQVPIETIYTRDHGGVSPTYGFRHLVAMVLWRL